MSKTLEQLTTERAEALDFVKQFQNTWKGKEHEIGADDEATYSKAMDSAINAKKEMDRIIKIRDSFSRTDLDLNQPLDQGSQNSGRGNTSHNGDRFAKLNRWSAKKSNDLVHVNDRQIYVEEDASDFFFSQNAKKGFLQLMQSAGKAETPYTKEYFEAKEKYNTVFRVSDPSRAGDFVMPEEMWSGILKTLDDNVHVQGLATVMNITAESLAIRMRLTKARSINWGSELSSTADNRESSLRYGKRFLKPNYLTMEYLISNALLKANFGIESMINQEIGIDNAEFFEQEFLSSDGAGGTPIGLLTAMPVGEGIDTSRDVALGSGVFTEEHLINMAYALKTQYRNNAVWMLHRLRVRDLAKIKGSDGHPLWRPSMIAGMPDTLLGRPMVVNEFMPTATSSTTYGILFGDFKWYWIIYRGSMEFQVLRELEARTNQTAFIGRMQMDAMPMMAEAFVRGQYA